MTVNASPRLPAFDIEKYFAPEIIDPTKPVIGALVFSNRELHREVQAGDLKYDLSKLTDHPVTCEYHYPGLREVMPRGIPWHDFPVVSAPFYRIAPFSGRPIEPSNPHSGTKTSSFPETDIIVTAFFGDARERANSAFETAYLLHRYGQDKRNVVDYEAGSLQEKTVSDLMKPMQAEKRFCYSYKVNFKAIAAKALRAVGADQTPVPGGLYRKGVKLCGKPSHGDDPSAHPLALQWLYRLRSMGSFDVSYASDLEEFRNALIAEYGAVEVTNHPVGLNSGLKAERAVFLKLERSDQLALVFDETVGNSPELSAARHNVRRKGIDFIEIPATRRVIMQLSGKVTKDASVFFALDRDPSGGWKGTGKHTPLAVAGDVETIPMWFIETGLVAYDQNLKTIAVSDKGHRFLELLHPDCEDPDVMLRWIGDDGFFREGCEKACDDWIMRFFRKMKTRVNEIRS